MVSKILVVDDDADILKLLERVLKAEGYHVLKAASGQEAVEANKTFSPDLVVMDIMMPDVYGTDIIREIKTNSTIKDVPVIFLSGIAGGADDGMPVSTINVGGYSYPAVAKPFEVKHVLAEVRKALCR